jgi:ATP-binding cassette subfamily F protein 3
MIQLAGVTKTFAGDTLFENITLQVRENSRLGLVGRNGCGKSTLLKLMMGIYSPDGGNIARTPGCHVNYLSQEPQLTPGLTLYEEMKQVYAVVDTLRDEETRILEGLEKLDADAQVAAITRLCEVQEQINMFDVDTLDSRIGKLLLDLGFTQADYDRKTDDFSGGWRMRVNLAKVLLEGADILLLDEPTNHLDLESCEWLEQFLKGYQGGIVLVSHDRRFLDEVTTEIAEVELGGATVWTGNYSAFQRQKADLIERTQSAYDRQQKEIAKQTAFVERFKASANRSTQAKSRERQLAKLERVETIQTDNTRMSVKFPPPQPSGREVISLRDLKKSFGDKHLFKGLEGDIEKNQRIFLLGENGCGKTTLFRLLLGLEQPDSGTIERGYNVKQGYFSQNQLETLDAKKSPFDTLHETAPLMTHTEIRGLLARFLFSGDEVFKAVEVLSGGEKSKLAIAKLMLTGPNTLLLDEPTNHMDIPAKEVLAEAFKEFDGTILCISHDRFFIQELATHIWEIYEGHLIQYAGDYDYYLFKRDELRAKTLADAASRTARESKKVASVTMSLGADANGNGKVGNLSPLQARKEVEKRITKQEKQIVSLETQIATLETQLADPPIQQDFNRLHALSQDLQAKKSELDQANGEWERLTEELLTYPVN